IIDLSSNTDVSPPTLWERLKAYVDYNYVSQPKNLKNLAIIFLSLFILIFVLDGTHLGQAIIHGISSYLAKFISIIVVAVLIVIAFFIVVVGFIVFLEKRKED
ncbi:MAG: hypothetical protein CEN92_297, partial [Candidatus Berkelbacteria bacterium Licking1014_96]